MTANSPLQGDGQADDADIFKFSPRELSKRAKEQGEKAPAPLRQSVCLYYISRYLFSLYEIAFTEMPANALNEYRNGLDHFMRFLSSGGSLDADDEHGNLHKMQGHFQRAALDMCKEYAYGAEEWVRRFESQHGSDVLALVSDGAFWEEMQRDKQKAERAFEEAKLSDAALGEHPRKNDDVVDAYLNAAHLWYCVRALCLHNADKIAWAQKEHSSIGKQAKNLSLVAQFFLGVVILLLGIGLGKLLE